MNDPNYYADQYNAYNKKPKKISVLDSTLREGEQHPGVSFTNKQRIQIAWMLDYFGVDQIEISPVISKDHQQATKTRHCFAWTCLEKRYRHLIKL